MKLIEINTIATAQTIHDALVAMHRGAAGLDPNDAEDIQDRVYAAWVELGFGGTPGQP